MAVDSSITDQGKEDSGEAPTAPDATLSDFEANRRLRRNIGTVLRSDRAIPWPRPLQGMPAPVLRGLAPPKREPVVVFGMSHIKALAMACVDSKEDRLALVFVKQRRKGMRTANLAPPLFARYRPKAVISMIGGNFHNLFGLLEHPEPFDFTDPGIPELDTTRRIVPRSEMRALFKFNLADNLKRIGALSRFYGVPMAHIASPPPNSDEEHLRKHLGGMAHKAGLDPKFTPKMIRLKLYRLQNEILAEGCKANGVTFISAPAKTIDEEGFLSAHYRQNDPTHGNSRYGKQVLRDVRGFAADAGLAEFARGSGLNGEPDEDGDPAQPQATNGHAGTP
ncbi:MAG: hypothetical protein AAGD34_19975 [Pseudomonadota bacterium]